MGAGKQLVNLSEDERLILCKYMKEKRAQIDRALEEILPPAGNFPTRIVEAMRYTLFSGGKRLRPILTLASAEAVGGDADRALPAACAIELIHTYSLIHDDLPAVDDDDFRRGKPSSHKVFGEAMAIFAGDALLTHAFAVTADASRTSGTDPALLLKVSGDLARAVGVEGMIGGQSADIAYQGKNIEPALLNYIHIHKTAALIRVSCSTGAILGGGAGKQIDAISDYGGKIGLAFQIVDDLLDEANSEQPESSDSRLGKATYPSVYGSEKSRQEVKKLIEEALAHLSCFDSKADALRMLACFIGLRTH